MPRPERALKKEIKTKQNKKPLMSREVQKHSFQRFQLFSFTERRDLNLPLRLMAPLIKKTDLTEISVI